jgi:TadE-like protein
LLAPPIRFRGCAPEPPLSITREHLLKSQHGQSFVELALVVFLFTLFIIGIMQFVMLGTAKIKCQIAARRAAWNMSLFNNAEMERHKQQRLNLLPNSEKPKRIDQHGSREKGMAFEISTKVRAIGFFQVLKPDGFTITAQSAVISYNRAPVAPKLVEKGFEAISELWQSIQ